MHIYKLVLIASFLIFFPYQSQATVTGSFDGVFREGSNYYLQGWTCQIGNPASIAIHIYVGNNGPEELIQGEWATEASVQPLIGTLCGSSGLYFRFKVLINSQMTQHEGKRLYVYGLTPTEAGLLGGSGSHYLLSTPVAATPFSTKIGIYYLLWHCPFAEGNGTLPIYDISKALSGAGPWGPVGQYHYWAKPRDGYYCLSRRPDIIRRHAEMLRDAGIDFVHVDATNHSHIGWGDRPNEMIMQPFNAMLAIWSTVPGAPKIVPWGLVNRIPGREDWMIDWMTNRLEAYPGLHFIYRGKPLVIVGEALPSDPEKLAQLRTRFTVRTMWVDYPEVPHKWGFFRYCADNAAFKNSSGTTECNQRPGLFGGQVEQISITTAYQRFLMSDPRESIPKFGGRTFVRQFDTLFNNSTAPIATITGWNEWIAIRFCYDSAGNLGAGPCDSRYNDKSFVDLYDQEYNRDIEPQEGGAGDFYYRLMKVCIEKFRLGQRCDVSSINETPTPTQPPPPSTANLSAIPAIVGTGASVVASFFDEAFYVTQNPDVGAAVRAGHFASGFQHYVLYGGREGRSPNTWFNEQSYRMNNPDVVPHIGGGFLSGYEHYLRYGAREGRAIITAFNERSYMTANPDVYNFIRLNSNILYSGYHHYILHGRAEGRSLN